LRIDSGTYREDLESRGLCLRAAAPQSMTVTPSLASTPNLMGAQCVQDDISNPEPAPIDICRALSAWATAFRTVLGPKVDLTLSLSPVPAVLADPIALQLLLLELMRNAREATPRLGEVHVETRCAHCIDTTRAVLLVSDSGRGMTSSELEWARRRVEEGRASGVSGTGLRRVGRIAASFGASVGMTTWLGTGTTVKLGFPAVGPYPFR
jgi:signal transduction histidine kinase